MKLTNKKPTFWFGLPCSSYSRPLCYILLFRRTISHVKSLFARSSISLFLIKFGLFCSATHFEISRLFTGSSLGTDFKIWLAKLIILLSSWRLSWIGKSANTQFIFEFKVSMWPTGPLALKPKEIWNN